MKEQTAQSIQDLLYSVLDAMPAENPSTETDSDDMIIQNDVFKEST